MGKFIVFDGIDGSGKSTQAELLAKALRRKGYKVFLTAEPYKEGLRDLIKNKFIAKKSKINDGILDALLFTADRRIHMLKELNQKLKENDIVISDRFYHATLAYQHTQGVDMRWLAELNSFALKPDLTIIFDVSPKLGLKRVLKGERKKIDKFEKTNFLIMLRKNYLKLPKLLRGEKIVVINANGSLEKVFEITSRVVKRELKLRI